MGTLIEFTDSELEILAQCVNKALSLSDKEIEDGNLENDIMHKNMSNNFVWDVVNKINKAQEDLHNFKPRRSLWIYKSTQLA